MLNPPFPLRAPAATWAGELDISCPKYDGHPADTPKTSPSAATRRRLGELDSHLHCSVIGTCLSTAELRRLMSRFVDVCGADDLHVHHEAVRLAALNAEVARALHKALDRRHVASVQRFAKATDAAALAELWSQSLKSGEVPGAYWAVLTHRRVTPELRQQVFGDVHMLSHLVGAANRADIRRTIALEEDNADLRERTERQQQRLAELLGEREQGQAERDDLRARIAELECNVQAQGGGASAEAASVSQAMSGALAVQTRRRELAEGATLMLHAEVDRLRQELECIRAHSCELTRELAAAEAQLREDHDSETDESSALRGALVGRRLLYVGGRPSSNPAIRDLVVRSGGQYQRHDGGIEDRKGLLASALSWADLVVFPVDCVDHDSAQALKRACVRQGTHFVPLRSASVASFAAAITANSLGQHRGGLAREGPCPKHG
jgi:hypothetical protein